jgi:hypothetical protein
MGYLSVIFCVLSRKLCLKITKQNSNHRGARKNKVDIYGPPVFSPDSSATDLAAKM